MGDFDREAAGVCRFAGQCLIVEPGADAEGIDDDAELVGGDEAEPGCADVDDADNDAVDGGDDQAYPELAAEQNGGQDGQATGEIVQTKHGDELQSLRIGCGRMAGRAGIYHTLVGGW